MFGGGGGESLGTAYGDVVISASGVRRGMDEAKREFRGGIQEMSSMVTGFGDSVSRLGSNLTMMTAPLALAFGSGVNAAATFDSALTEISARTGIVGEDLQAVSEYAQQMGAETVFSAQDAAEGLLQLLSSGQTLEQAMSTLPMVMQAAAASGEDLGMTADMVTNVMASFQLGIDRLTPSARLLADQLGVTNDQLVQWSMQGDDPPFEDTPADILAVAEALGMTAEEFYVFLNATEDASTVVESLSRAAGASSADIASLGQGLANVGPVADQFGMSVDQTVAALAIFAENGVAGAEAGTMLKSMLLNMSDNTDTVVGAWNELGVSLYDTEGNVRNINTVMMELDAALDQLPVEDQNRLIQDLAGSYGIVGFNALRAGTSISEMQGMMEEQASAAEVAATMMETFQNMVGSLGGSVESLQIAVFTPFMNDVLRPIVGQLIEVVNGVTAWVRANPALTSTILKIASALIALGPTLFGVGKFISFIGTTIGLLANPFAWIGAALAGLVFAFETNFLGIRDILQPVFDTIGTAISLFTGSLEAGTTPIQALRSGLTALFGGELAASITNFIQDVVERVQSFVATIGEAFSLFGYLLGQGLTPMQAFTQTLRMMFGDEAANSVGGFVEMFASAFGGIISFVQSTVLPILGQLLSWFITEGLPAAVNFLQTTVIPAVQEFTRWLGDIWAQVSPHLTALWQWFTETALPGIITFITETVIPTAQDLITWLGALWTKVEPHLTALWQWFTETALPGIVDFIENTAGPAIESIKDFLVGIWALGGEALKNLAKWFETSGINDKIEGVSGVVEDLQNWLSGIWTAVQPALQPLIDFFGGILEDARNTINMITDLGNAITGGGPAPQDRSQPINFSAAGGNNAFVNNAGINSSGGFGGGRDSGGSGLPNMAYGIGRSQADNEIFVPRTEGNFIPNFMETVNQAVSAAIGGAQGGGGDLIIQNLNANSFEGGYAAVQGATSAWAEERRRRGLK